MTPLYSIIIFPLLLTFFLATSANGASNWVEYGRSDRGNIFEYNKASIRQKEDIIQVQRRVFFSDEGREIYILGLKKSGVLPHGLDRLSNSLSLEEIDCKKETYQIVSVTHYGADGMILYTHSYDEPDWIEILPDSVNDILRKMLCR